jgi:hypothetical protein
MATAAHSPGMGSKAYILLVLKTWLGNQASHDDTPTPVQAELDFGDPYSP